MSRKKQQNIRFTKMHGAGNDYIYVDTFLFPISHPEEVARRWSDRHKGIGADGLVLIGRPDDVQTADFSMRIFNADGSEAMMCGNASRCIGKYVYERGLTTKTEVRLQTLSGVKTLWLHLSDKGDSAGKAYLSEQADSSVESVTVDMGCPRFDVPEQYRPAESLADGGAQGVFVSMGNPHFVVFVDDVSQVDVAGDGSILEHDECFPERCNIEFAEWVRGDESLCLSEKSAPVSGIRVRVWERGSGITMACGTGACATAVAAIKTGRTDGRRCLIRMDGGDLLVEWCERDRTEQGRHYLANHVYLTGPAAFVFDGDIPSPLQFFNSSIL